jgi:hypothetical protein
MDPMLQILTSMSQNRLMVLSLPELLNGFKQDTGQLVRGFKENNLIIDVSGWTHKLQVVFGHCMPPAQKATLCQVKYNDPWIWKNFHQHYKSSATTCGL